MLAQTAASGPILAATAVAAPAVLVSLLAHACRWCSGHLSYQVCLVGVALRADE